MSSAQPDFGAESSSGAGAPSAGSVPSELVGRSVILVPMRDEHVERLVAILAEPSVERWWPSTDDAGRRRHLEPEEDVIGFAVLARPGRDVIGYLQTAEETDPDFRHAGIDLFLTGDRQGRGHGPDAIRTAIRWLIAERGHHRITIDPAADNAQAIRAYEKVGFRRVGTLRRYQRFADGTWRDGLLMELLAEELTPD
jgi:aminoglycoside 6'-N-acetyltransferase